MLDMKDNFFSCFARSFPVTSAFFLLWPPCWRVCYHPHPLMTALAQGYSAFPIWQPSFHGFTLPDPQVLSALCWQDPQGSVFHLRGFFVLSVGQATTKRLRPWLFTNVAAFLDFQRCIPYGLLVGNLGADWLVFLKVLLSLCIRWAGMLCWKHFHGGNAEILILPVAVSCLAVLCGLFS